MAPSTRCSARADHFVMPGFVNCHYHSELAIGPGLYQYIYERAHVYVGSALGPIAEQDLYNAILWGLVTAIKGGQTGTVDMFYGRPSLTDFGCPAALQAYEDAGMRTMFGLVCRDQNTIVHEEDEAFLRRLPPRARRGGAALADGHRLAPRPGLRHLRHAAQGVARPARPHPDRGGARLDARPARTSSTCAAIASPPSTTRAC